MKQELRKFKCGNCDTGIVKVSIKKSGDTTTVTTKACDNKKCKRWYGIKGISILEEMPDVETAAK